LAEAAAAIRELEHSLEQTSRIVHEQTSQALAALDDSTRAAADEARLALIRIVDSWNDVSDSRSEWLNKLGLQNLSADEMSEHQILRLREWAHALQGEPTFGEITALLKRFEAAISKSEVPRTSYRLLHAFLPRRDQDSIERQLEEQFLEDIRNRRIGPKLARWYYRWNAIREITSAAWNVVNRIFRIGDIISKFRGS